MALLQDNKGNLSLGDAFSQTVQRNYSIVIGTISTENHRRTTIKIIPHKISSKPTKSSSKPQKKVQAKKK